MVSEGVWFVNGPLKISCMEWWVVLYIGEIESHNYQHFGISAMSNVAVEVVS